MKNYKTNNEIKEWASVMQDYMVRCKCGHKVYIRRGDDKEICSVCRNYVFKDKKAEFEYKIKQQLKTNKNRA